MQIHNAIVVYTIPRTKEQTLCLDAIVKILHKHKIKMLLADREKLKKTQFSGKDITIAVGGDGTFLRAAQFIEKIPILGVNAEPLDKEGFFMKSDKTDFEEKLLRIINDYFKIRYLSRLEARI